MTRSGGKFLGILSESLVHRNVSVHPLPPPRPPSAPLSPLFGSSTRDKFSVSSGAKAAASVNRRERAGAGRGGGKQHGGRRKMHSLAWFYCRYFRRSLGDREGKREISCLAEELNLVTDSLYFIHIIRDLFRHVLL